MVCKKCGREFDGSFCPYCGERAEQEMTACPVCGKEKADGVNFCANCGYSFVKSENAVKISEESAESASEIVKTAEPKAKTDKNAGALDSFKNKIVGLFDKIDERKRLKLLRIYRFIPSFGVLLFAVFTFLSLCSPIMLHYGYAVCGTGLENAFSNKVSAFVTTSCALLFVLFVAEVFYFAFRLTFVLSKPYSDAGNKKIYFADGAMITASFVLSVCAVSGAGKWVASPGAGVTFLLVISIFAALFLVGRIYLDKKVIAIIGSNEKADLQDMKTLHEAGARSVRKKIKIASIITLCVGIVAATINLPVQMVYYNFTNSSSVVGLTNRYEVEERFGLPEGYSGEESGYTYSAGDKVTYDRILADLDEAANDFSEEDFEDMFESEDSLEDAFNDFMEFDSYIEKIEDARRYASYKSTTFVFDENDSVKEYYCEVVNYSGGMQEERNFKAIEFEGTIEEQYTDIANIDYLAKYDDGSFIGGSAEFVTDGIEGTFSDRFGEYTINVSGLQKVDPSLISGSGYVKDGTLYVVEDADSVLEYGDAGAVTEIVIEDSVTSITADAFAAFTSVSEISGGKDLTYIGENAFATTAYYNDIANWSNGVLYIDDRSVIGVSSDATELVVKGALAEGVATGNTSLRSVVISDGVTSIVYNAFRGCSGLTSVTIGNGVTSIGPYAFYGCSGLTSITIPDSVTSIGDYAFYDCSGLTSVTIPDGVTWIGSYAFRYCSGLTSVTIPDGVTSIGGSVFYGCNGLTSITIPDSVTSIGYNAFRGCSGLTSVTIPDSVTSIGDNAFDECSGLTSVTIGNGVTSIGRETFSGCNGLTSITIPDSVTSIGEYAFYRCSGLTSVTIPDGVTSIGDDAFWDCSGLTDVYYTGDLAGWLNIEFDGSYANPKYHADNLYIAGELLEGDIVIPDGVTKINDYTFYGCSGLTSVTIGNGITSIGNQAFSGCSGLTSITIPDSVTRIGGNAFPGGLTDVYYTGDLAGWLNIEFTDYDSNPMCYADNLYIAGELLEGDIVIPDGVTKINAYTFYNCSGLTSVIIPDSVTSIGNQAFLECSGLTSVTIPDSVTIIGDLAFYECSGLTSVTIGNGVTIIGDFAFDGCRGLTDVYYTGDLAGWMNIEFVAYRAHPMCNADNLYIAGELLEGDIVIPDGETKINDYTFYRCRGLTSVIIGNGVTSIGDDAFYRCSGLTSVIIGNGVTSIGDDAFYRCSGLTSVTIPDSVMSIGHTAFEDCSGLTSITFQGTMQQWKDISKGYDWNNNTGDYTVTCTDGVLNKND